MAHHNLKMVKSKYRLKRFGKILLFGLLGFLVVFGGASTFIYFKKDDIVAKVLDQTNEGYKGLVFVGGTQISPFKNFPYISVRLKDVKVFETKTTDTLPLLDIKDAYIGFDFWRIVNNDLQIKKITLAHGSLTIVQYANNEYNILRAFQPLVEETAAPEKSLKLALDQVQLTNVVLIKDNLSTKIRMEAQVSDANATLKKTAEETELYLNGRFQLNIFKDHKPTYVYHKNLELQTNFVYHEAKALIDFKKSKVLVKGSEFDMLGTIDLDDDLLVDIKFSGKKPNFDLFIALAPEDLIPTLRAYDNRGQVYFDAHVLGRTANNQTPAINVRFGCEDGYVKNKEANKVLDQLGFHGTFTNGAECGASTSVFELKDFGARPEAGKFKANLKVVNFDSPDIDLRLDADFDLDFLTQFLKLKDLSNLSGQVLLSMNFHDIIDLQQPEKALQELNQAYFSELKIKNLNFRSDSYHLPLKNLNVEASITGEDLDLKNCSFLLGENDLTIHGKVSNIPAVLHKANEIIQAELHVKSNTLDIQNLMPISEQPSTVDEVVSNLTLDLSFNGKANTFIASKSLPVGNYYLTNISAQLKNYHHQLNGLNGVFYINENDVLIQRLDGKLDTSDFHFNGSIGHYDLWLAAHKEGDTDIDFDLTSNELHFKDIFTYKGTNFMPKEYRDEDIKALKLHGQVSLHYLNNVLTATDLRLTELQGQLKMHPLKLHGFRGHARLEKDLLTLTDLSGNLGQNDLKLQGTYGLKESADFHKLSLQSKRLNINELLSYQPPVPNEKVDHDAGPNIFKEPFPNLVLHANINELTYKNFHLKNVIGQVKVQADHMVYLDKMRFEAANGLVDVSGYFNGTDPEKIYLSPDIKLQRIDLDQVLFKFDNFGQDHLISDNLHGLLTGRITGKILLHTDLTPMINDSDLQMDVSIDHGRLDNFAPMQAMSSYFGDKNLNRIRFDKLENRFILKNGALSFPNMTINSTLGYMEIAGSQTTDLQMDYFMRIPLKVVGKAAFNKLFNRNPNEVSPEQEDELIIKDPEKRTRFINVRLIGTLDDYKISLEKNKDLKAGIQFKKTDDFLFDDLESELEEN
jgi:hypothetical protein